MIIRSLAPGRWVSLPGKLSHAFPQTRIPHDSRAVLTPGQFFYRVGPKLSYIFVWTAFQREEKLSKILWSAVPLPSPGAGISKDLLKNNFCSRTVEITGKKFVEKRNEITQSETVKYQMVRTKSW